MSDNFKIASNIKRDLNAKWRRGIRNLKVFILMAAVAFPAFAIANGSSNNFFDRGSAYAIAGGVTFIFGMCAFYFRDVSKRRFYPYTELVLGITAGSFFVREGESLITRLIILFAGIRIVADGLRRLKEGGEFDRLRKYLRDDSPSDMPH